MKVNGPVEGTVELHVRVDGVHYALGLELADFPKDDDLAHGLKILTTCLRTTILAQGYWKTAEGQE